MSVQQNVSSSPSSSFPISNPQINDQDLTPFDELLTQQFDVNNQAHLPFQKYRKKNPRLQIIKIMILIMVIISLICYTYLT